MWQWVPEIAWPLTPPLPAAVFGPGFTPPPHGSPFRPGAVRPPSSSASSTPVTSGKPFFVVRKVVGLTYSDTPFSGDPFVFD